MSKVPIFDAPKIVVQCMAVIALCYVAVLLMPAGASDEILPLLAFRTGRYTDPMSLPPLEMGAAIWSFVTHQFIHVDAALMLFNAALLLIFGSGVATRVGWLRFLVLAVLGGVVGALVFLAHHFGGGASLIGATGAAFAVMGGASRFFFPALARGGFEAFRRTPKAVPLMTVRETLSDQRFLVAVGLLVLLGLVSSAGNRWEAELGGFLFGWLSFDYFEPPRRPRLEIVRRTLH